MLAAIVASASAAFAPACFYTNPINSRPAAEIEVQTPGVLHKGDTVTVSARKTTDPNHSFDELSFTWRAVVCPTPMSCNPHDQGGGTTFNFDIPGHDPMRVELTAVDPQGAHHSTDITIVPVNRPPTVQVFVEGRQNAAGGYTIGRELEVHAAGDDGADHDPLTYEFTYFPPPASQSADVIWQRIDEDSYRLLPDVTGMWQVSVVASDGIEPSQPVLRAFQVDVDAPPCIGSTTPGAPAGPDVARYILRRVDPPRRFAVLSVIDDLDPYPIPQGDDDPLLATPRFRWSVTPPGGTLDWLPGYDLPDYWFDPAAYAPGAVATVRVDVSDRVVRGSKCADDVAICPATGTCRQRLSWEVEIR